jgi:rRNA processing protein Gar1
MEVGMYVTTCTHSERIGIIVDIIGQVIYVVWDISKVRYRVSAEQLIVIGPAL